MCKPKAITDVLMSSNEFLCHTLVDQYGNRGPAPIHSEYRLLISFDKTIEKPIIQYRFSDKTAEKLYTYLFTYRHVHAFTPIPASHYTPPLHQPSLLQILISAGIMKFGSAW